MSLSMINLEDSGWEGKKRKIICRKIKRVDKRISKNGGNKKRTQAQNMNLNQKNRKLTMR